MNISGVLIHVKAEKMDSVSKELNSMEGVEVHAAENGKLVVTAEHKKLNALADLVMSLQHLKNVMSVAMVYHESDDNEKVEIEEVLAEVGLACTIDSCQENSVQEVSL